jgi:predicted oxidoreductase
LLGRERIDVLLIHRPDLLMDARETAEAFDTLIGAGTIGYAGVSNFTVQQIELLHAALKNPLVTNQVEFSPLHLDPIGDGTLDQAQRLDFRPMLWSPFGGGSLFSGDAPQGARVRAALEGVAENYGLGIAGKGAGPAAIAWLIRHPCNPVPVVGTSNLDRLKGLVAAANVTLDRQDWYAIYEAILGRPVA